MSRNEPDRAEVFASVVMILDGNDEAVVGFIREASSELERRYSDHEILIIAQGARVLSQTVLDTLGEWPRLRLVALTRHVEERVALAAGLENAIGDFVLLVDPVKDSPEAAIRAIELARAGNDIVIGCARQPMSLACRLGKPLLDTVMARVIHYDPPKGQTLLRCMSRATVNAVTESSRFHHQLNLRILETGAPIHVMPYELTPAGLAAPPLSFRGELRRAISLAVFSSTVPLRIMSAAGFFGSLLAFAIGIYSFAIRLFKDAVIEGWTTMVAFMSILFMLLFAILAFFGEYLSRILDDNPGQQHYKVAFERTSTVMVDEGRLNVLKRAGGADTAGEVAVEGRDAGDPQRSGVRE